MQFSDIIGLDHIKKHLTTTADKGRIPHAQLFAGSHGSGTLPMAIAYAQYLLCTNSEGENNDRKNQLCNKNFKKLIHPDLHFSFPSATNKEIKSKPSAQDFLNEWREFALKSPYGSLYEWFQHLGIAGKQGQIRLRDAQNIADNLSLKSFSGGFKVVIIWHAELMNLQTANYLLKLIEEPPEKTVFILITENEQQIIQTIRSRCQLLNFPPLGQHDIKTALQSQHHCQEQKATKIAFQSEGNYARALQVLNQNKDDKQFEEWFIDWVRTAFQAKGNKGSIIKLTTWADKISKTGRETQKRFLAYCLDFMRQALLKNYQAESLVYLQPGTKNFKLSNFAPFIHGNNIQQITEELEKAIYHIERNGNSKIIFTDLSIKLTRYLHKKPS